MAAARITTSDYIGKYKTMYKLIKPIFSKAIGDVVYFNMRGFKHLIFKNGRHRPTKAILNRLVLIPLISPVIRNCEEEKEIRIRKEVIDGKKVSVTYLFT